MEVSFLFLIENVLLRFRLFFELGRGARKEQLGVATSYLVTTNFIPRCIRGSDERSLLSFAGVNKISSIQLSNINKSMRQDIALRYSVTCRRTKVET